MQSLEAINRMLRLTGHQSVNAVDEGDARAALAIQTLTQVRRDILTTPYQFNHLRIDLPVDISGKVPIARKWLSVVLPKNTLAERYDEANNAVFVWDINADDWHDSLVQKVIVTYDIVDFPSIPESFAQWIAYEAAQQYFAEHKGGDGSSYIERRLNQRRQIAINQNPPISIDSAIGHTLVKLFHLYR